MRFFVFLFLSLITITTVNAQELTQQETQLYHLIMEYRAAQGLPMIPISASLTYVAKVHAKDLANYQPDEGNCNMHSWSRNGDWTPCCYTSDHAKAKCMWDKPKELTNYTGNGFEIAYWSSAGANPQGALNSWKKSRGHNTVIVNKGIWKTHPWEAIGISIYGNYAVVWFGEEKDAE